VKTLHYYACARNDKGEIEQLLVTKPAGMVSSQLWTGKIYKDEKEALTHLGKLNQQIAEQYKKQGKIENRI